MLAAAGCVSFNNPEGWAGPSAVDNLLVTSTDKGELSALGREDFSAAWTFPTGDEEPELDLEAIYGAPLVIEGTVYLAGYSGDVFALSLETGEPVWELPFDAGDPIIAALVTDGTAVYVATDGGLLYALDPETGQQKMGPFDAGDSIWATPLLDDGVIYVASVDGKLVALDAEAFKPVWDRPFQTEHGLISDPVLADGTILIGGIGRTLHAVDAGTGEERWSFKAGNWFWGRPLVEDGTVYVPNLDGNLYALSLTGGEKQWSFEAEEPLRSSPVLAEGHLVIADRDGNVYGLDPDSGELKWSGPPIDETVLSNPLVLMEASDEGEDVERVFISAEGGDLYRLDDPITGSLSRLELSSGRFVKVVAR